MVVIRDYDDIINKLDILLTAGVAKHDNVAWGNGFRNVLFIGEKRYQFNGKNISKLLENKIFSSYIEMTTGQTKRNTKNTAKSIKDKLDFIKTYNNAKIEEKPLQTVEKAKY